VLLPGPAETLERRIASHTEEAKSAARREHRLGFERANGASIVAAANDADAPPAVALDHLVRRYPHADAYAVVTSKRSALAAIRLNGWSPGAAPCGYTVTMTAATEKITAAGFGSPPVTLYAALLFGWARWWVLGARDLTERSVGLADLPPPPLALDLVEAWQAHRVVLEAPERVTWHRPASPRTRQAWPGHGD
jgi:hypothetical protein